MKRTVVSPSPFKRQETRPPGIGIPKTSLTLFLSPPPPPSGPLHIPLGVKSVPFCREPPPFQALKLRVTPPKFHDLYPFCTFYALRCPTSAPKRAPFSILRLKRHGFRRASSKLTSPPLSYPSGVSLGRRAKMFPSHDYFPA